MTGPCSTNPLRHRSIIHPIENLAKSSTRLHSLLRRLTDQLEEVSAISLIAENRLAPVASLAQMLDCISKFDA
jgi:hypothetical protein